MRKFSSGVIVTDENAEIVSVKDAAFMRLWDLYSPLLTAHQREITDLYFNYDLSLGEIAEQKGVSRQSVSDCLVKCRKQLEDYEEKLGFLTAFDEVNGAFSLYMTRVERWLKKQKEAHPEIQAEIEALENRLKEDEKEQGTERTVF
ncbi:MAG: DNA-binding protein [Clostridia bacterium]|nr:DNA-binding protein [Clostridia bacterium]